MAIVVQTGVDARGRYFLWSGGLSRIPRLRPGDIACCNFWGVPMGTRSWIAPLLYLLRELGLS